MTRYKTIDLSPRFSAMFLEKQLLSGSLAHAVRHLLEHDFNLSGFDTRYCNDDTGASAACAAFRAGPVESWLGR